CPRGPRASLIASWTTAVRHSHAGLRFSGDGVAGPPGVILDRSFKIMLSSRRTTSQAGGLDPRSAPTMVSRRKEAHHGLTCSDSHRGAPEQSRPQELLIPGANGWWKDAAMFGAGLRLRHSTGATRST